MSTLGGVVLDAGARRFPQGEAQDAPNAMAQEHDQVEEAVTVVPTEIFILPPPVSLYVPPPAYSTLHPDSLTGLRECRPRRPSSE